MSKMSSIVAYPLSRQDIRYLTQLIRTTVGLDKNPYFPVVEFLEFGMPQFDPNFCLRVVEKEAMGDYHGITYPQNSCITIREDVYENAIRGSGRDRFTIAHEIGHYFLHKPGTVALARIENGESVVTYRDPEWQANAFAGELLIPAHLVKGLTIDEIVKVCNVTVSAARVQWKKINNM